MHCYSSHMVLKDLTDSRMLRLLVTLCILTTSLAQDCQVSNIQVKKNFDKYRFQGTWYAVASKSPTGLFLLENAVVTYTINIYGGMTGSAFARVNIMNNWETCANMLASFYDTQDPAKFKMKYEGAEDYLPKGNHDHWIIDTDYNNYAVQYTCGELDVDGTCRDSYSFILSRHPYGLRPADKKIVNQRKQDLCLYGKYRQLTHKGFCNA